MTKTSNTFDIDEYKKRTKLKTLNDLNWFIRAGDNRSSVVKEDLKALAIKWVKEVPKRRLDVDDWMEFFNITEEELK